VMTGKGAMMQIDTANTVMLPSLNLVDFLAKMFKKPAASLTPDMFGKAEKEWLRGNMRWNICHPHSMRTFKLRGLTSVGCDQDKFTIDQVTDADGQVTQPAREISVYQYFKEKFPQMTLKYPQYPSVLVGKAKDPGSVRLPLEICNFVSCQPAPITPNVQQFAITKCCQLPRAKFNDISAVHNDLLREQNHDQSARAFGFTLGDALVVTNAKQLRPPVLTYKNRGQDHQVTVDSAKGQWNLRGPGGSGDLGFMKPGARQKAWIVVNFKDFRSDEEWKALSQFIGALETLSQQRGIDLGENLFRRHGRPVNAIACRSGEDVVRKLNSEVEHNPGVGLIVCVLNDKFNEEFLYPAIKRWSHTQSGIATQCVRGDKCTTAKGTGRGNPAYIAGILLKMNLKLGGHNVYARDGLQLMRSKPTIVFGVDVNHASPSSTKPSYAALVATMDREGSEYFTTVNAQTSRKELVDLKDKVRAALRNWKSKNGEAPQQIIFYRDGVAHNQFENECRLEVQDIRDACQEEGGQFYNPEVRYIVVQQRTRCRLAMQGQNPPNQQGSNVPQGLAGNVPAGTVVDEGIVGGAGNDFYIVAHNALKGTARPLHCHVLVNDEPKVSLAEFQRITFDFCHLYARATKIVSRPAPVYYAHRAAFLAQYYEADYRDKSGNRWETTSTSSAGSHGSGSRDAAMADIKLHPAVSQTVYFA